MTRRLVLVRHGQTEWNLLGRAQGHADISLDAIGHAQAAAAAPYLAALAPVRLWSSDLARARETAAYVAEAAGLPVETDPRLREYDVGVRSGPDRGGVRGAVTPASTPPGAPTTSPCSSRARSPRRSSGCACCRR